FLIIGIAAILLAIIFWFFIKTNPSFFKGAAIPLLAIGVIPAVVGYSVYSRTDKQVKDIAYNMGMEPVAYTKTVEMPRMEKVMQNFAIYRWVEIAFIIAGLILIILYRNDSTKTFWYGLGVALAIQAMIMLGADYFAEKRGKLYVEQLKKMIAD
ncbi:MAG TPA: hypothetical protein VHL77_01485, partial [Ferruginibacter sp.]|nr:hypothetical protein [Ferruginibacter sp.]